MAKAGIGGEGSLSFLRHLPAVFLFFMGVAIIDFALSGATLGTATDSRWSGATAGSDTTEGGNITYVSITSTSLTDKWAAYYGNVSGTINLTNGTNSVFSWSWTSATGGEVCITQNNTGLIESLLTAATAANINTAFSHGVAADNATNTFTAANCTMNFAQATVSSAPYARHLSQSTFYTCAIYDGAGTSSKAGYLFCTNISTSGRTYHNQSFNYEIMVPTSPGTGTETYYFYAELN